MRKVSVGRLERLQCLKCGAHVVVRHPSSERARCEVCGGDRLEPVPEQAPGSFSRVGSAHT